MLASWKSTPPFRHDPRVATLSHATTLHLRLFTHDLLNGANPLARSVPTTLLKSMNVLIIAQQEFDCGPR